MTESRVLLCVFVYSVGWDRLSLYGWEKSRMCPGDLNCYPCHHCLFLWSYHLNLQKFSFDIILCWNHFLRNHFLQRSDFNLSHTHSKDDDEIVGQMCPNNFKTCLTNYRQRYSFLETKNSKSNTELDHISQEPAVVKERFLKARPAHFGICIRI